ncbi:carbohydrate kinase family protein [Streptomyces millisiae]|uniref:Carbohydrate kinase family protein n=1 Tax=Streptomyces millisiae TaxID=3075542 RepID=A0ABU2LJ91_9ACTN|nr:carbohydrate kinase family protein [Streptomyces sp. DSM 44918]MDT0317654.1 carbohydrate kinase family protein [Streptomyces sp. DSM 44918]
MTHRDQAGDDRTPFDVFVIGGVGVDTIVRVPELPLPPRDSVMVPPIERYVAHTGNGVALGCHRLGLRTHLADVIGADFEGELITAHYAKAGLSFDHRIHPSGTRRSVNLVDRHGHRLSLYDARQPVGMTVDPDLYRPALGRVRHVHVSIMDWARHALADAVAAGLPTSTDLHDWDGESEHHRDFAYGADLVFVSTAALGDRVEDVARDILAKGRASAVVALAGGDGSLLALPGQPLRRLPASPVPGGRVVDTNGAGDSYVAGFLYARLGGADWPTAMRAGSAAGAHAVSTAGTHASFIDEEELARALS